MDHQQQQQVDESSPVTAQPLSQRSLTLEDPLPPASAMAPPSDGLTTAGSDAPTPTASNSNHSTADCKKDEETEIGQISQREESKKKPTTRRTSAGSGRRGSHGRRHSSGNVTNDVFRGNHHHRHSHNAGSHSIQSSLDLPLPIASLVDGRWQSRQTVHRTPRRIATLKLPTRAASSSSETEGGDGVDSDASATILCIAGQEYIVVANTVANGLGIYRLSSPAQHQSATSANATSTPLTPALSDPTDLVAPWCTVSLYSRDNDNDTDDDDFEDDAMADSNAAIVSLMALPWGQSLVYGESCRDEELHIVAVTDDGQVFIVRLRQGDAAVKLFEFSTMNFGVTCASVLPVLGPSSGPTTGSPGIMSIHNNSTPHPEVTLLVGYQSGYVENWRIFRFSSDKILSKMLWRGMYPSNYSIQNMMPLMYDPSPTNSIAAAESNPDGGHTSTAGEGGGNIQLHSPPSKISKRPSFKGDGIQLLSPSTKRPSFKENRSPKVSARKNNEIKDHPRYLLLTLYSPTDTLKTGSMVEVIDIGPLMSIWKGNDSTQEGLGRLRAINLSSPQRWIMPANGMDILPSSTIASAASSRTCDGCLPQRAHVIPSTGTGSICKYTRNLECNLWIQLLTVILFLTNLYYSQAISPKAMAWHCRTEQLRFFLPRRKTAI